MKKTIRLQHWVLVLSLFTFTAVLGTGCATNGRRVLLKEYGPTGPRLADQPLKGRTICIKGFQCVTNLIEPDPATKPEQPPQFTFVPYTSEQSKIWNKEFRELEKSAGDEGRRKIGRLRNGFGMVLSHVYALNEPSAWLVESLKMDLESQGAKVVDASQADAADLTISGTIRFCRVDIYMKIWGDLVVDLELQPKGRSVSHALLHTEGGTVAWVGSTSEFYTPLREARQKFSWLATREINKSLKP